MKRLPPLYIVVFNGFVGYSLMIAVFTPIFINGHGELAPTEWSLGTRSVVLGVVLSLYPLGQLIGSPILGALSGAEGISGLVGGLFAAIMIWLPLVALSAIALVGVLILILILADPKQSSASTSNLN